MHHAMICRKPSIARYLVQNVSADHLSTDNFHQTPLHYAILHGNVQMVRLLTTELRCDPNISDYWEYKFVHIAAQLGKLSI